MSLVTPEHSHDLADLLRIDFPQTVAAFEKMGALDQLFRIQQLEQAWAAIASGEYDPSIYQHKPEKPLLASQPDQRRFDLIYAGGGLGLLHAVAMAQRGWKVMIFDKGEIGCAHREWNISRTELSKLVEWGVASWEELESVIMRSYRTGVVRFHADQSAQQHQLWLPDVLDYALDATALLQLMRQKLAALGGVILDRRSFVQLEAGKDGVLVQLRDPNSESHSSYTARLLLDGMGSTSPLALVRHRGEPFAGVCPTVGTVAKGFVEGHTDPQQHDPEIGDILISIDHGQQQQQYMWEGFPGRDNQLTVYLFYYDTVRDKAKPHRLLPLFEDYFNQLPNYKQPGPFFRHLKPVYGYIPARHSLKRQERPLLAGVLPIGDSAAQQSPLTFCGFGSHVRNLARTTALLDYALRHQLRDPVDLAQISAFQSNVSLNWVFSRFMRPWNKPSDVNSLQNDFLAVLNDLGDDLSRRFFQDRMWWSDYHKMLLGTLKRRPQILADAWKVLGPRLIFQWIGDYLGFCAEAVRARVARLAGKQGAWLAIRLLDRYQPRLALRLRARYAEWQTMGWFEHDLLAASADSYPKEQALATQNHS
jgi:lycopene cyclase CruA